MTLLLLLTSPTGAAETPLEEFPLDRWYPDTTYVGTAVATIGIARPPGRFEQ